MQREQERGSPGAPGHHQTRAEHSGRLFLSWECWIGRHHTSSNSINVGKSKIDNNKCNNNQNLWSTKSVFYAVLNTLRVLAHVILTVALRGGFCHYPYFILLIYLFFSPP